MRARWSGSTWEINAPAKLNLYLEVLGRRDDGFHELDTLMTPVRLFDRLRWEPTPAAEPFSLTYDRATSADLQLGAPENSDNLAWRAFDRIAYAAGIEPHGRATLLKRIPIQAGLGGASADAAAALLLANSAWGIHYPVRRLAELAAELGSDVPFFLAGGAALCRGRGERVERVGGLPHLNVVLVKPPTGVSTPAAFAALSAPVVSIGAARNSQTRVKSLVDNLRSGALARAGRQMTNRLEDAATTLNPWIARLRTAFANGAVQGHAMTGSGSAYFGLCRSARQARQLASRLRAQLIPCFAELGAVRVYATATCPAASPPL
jgi:4-diphosphocytidyl-2-C-methyl-D-erythritol kinase